MFAPDDYTLGKCLHADADCEVHAAVRDSDGRKVALKSYRGATGVRLARARAELGALSALAGTGVVAPLELVDTPEGAVLVLDQLEGTSLRQWVAAGLPAEASVIELAIQVAETLMRVHAANWLHSDVRPEHVVVNSAAMRAQLIGLGLAQPFGSALPKEGLRARIGGSVDTLLFIAPEQTGRMGRGIDARSDLYALGATLYFALTGVPPLEGADALALVHAHMARVPMSPLAHRPGLSPTLARIVVKLLQKQPEDRYQTARAVAYDLRTCRDQLARLGRIDDELPLGTSDFPLRPLFRKNLYGREVELATLQAAYAGTVAGASKTVFVRGVAGAGKSTLVHELRTVLPSSGGYLAAGKFDLYRRDVPFAGLTAAFNALLDQIFTESEDRLARWRSDLEAALGGLGGALVDLIPELPLLLGDVQRAPALGPTETRTRLAIAVERLVRGCATRDHPLVLFLDDVQWADPGTLELIESLILHGDAQHLLVLLAYREEEVDATHPFAAVSTHVAARGRPAEHISLGAISVDSAALMLADTLGRPIAETRELAATVVRKTGGVPFLIQQFTLHLHALGLIHFVEGSGWSWDPATVDAAAIPEGAVGLMVAKLGRLDADAQAILQLASCVAYEFDVQFLDDLSGRGRASIEPALRSVAEEGLIAPSSQGFRFVHDRVREAAQAMLSAEARARVHFGVAEHLLSRCNEDEQKARVFEIVEHLNEGLPYVPDALHLKVVELNLEAGRRALSAGAAATAVKYLAAARRSFRDSDSADHGRLGFDLTLLSADSAFRTGDTKSALDLLEPIERYSLTRIDVARAVGLRIQIYSVTKPPMECVKYSLAALREFGVRWSLRPSYLRIALAVRRVHRLVRRRPDQNFLEPATSLDLDKLATILIIDLTGASLAQASVRFATLASCYVLYDYLRHGYVAQPGFTLTAYAMLSILIHGDATQAERLGRIALELNERAPDPLWDPRTECLLHTVLRPWFTSRRECVVPMQRTLENMWKVGDTEWIYHSDSMMIINDLLGGGQVAEIDRRLNALCEVAERDPRYTDFMFMRRAYQPLLETDPSLVRLDQDVFSDDIPKGVGWDANEPILRTVWLLVLCVYGRYDRALAEADEGMKTLFIHSPWSHVADYLFYRGLAASVLSESMRGLARFRQRRLVRRILRQLRRWSRSGPDFVQMAEILQAEQARWQGRTSRARALYQSAAQRATRQQFIHHAALAHERHASLLSELRRETEAAQFLEQAVVCYAEWGAQAKAAALRRTIAQRASVPSA